LSQPWGVSRCAPGNIACTGIWKVPALRGIKVCTGEHCVHWMINRAPTLPPPPRVPSPSPQGPHPTNYETQSQSQSQFWTWTWNQIQIQPQGPQPSPRVPTLTLPPRVPTLPTLKLNSIRKLETNFNSSHQGPHPTKFKYQTKKQTQIQISNWTQNSHSRASTKLWKQTWLILDLNLLMRSLRTGYEVFKL
jgi:hypothetical protein